MNLKMWVLYLLMRKCNPVTNSDTFLCLYLCFLTASFSKRVFFRNHLCGKNFYISLISTIATHFNLEIFFYFMPDSTKKPSYFHRLQILLMDILSTIPLSTATNSPTNCPLKELKYDIRLSLHTKQPQTIAHRITGS